MSIPRLLSVKELAEWLSISPAWINAHTGPNAKRPVIPHVRLGNRARFDPEKIKSWLQELQQKQGAA